jgi:pimeloyl-ACP methyl ester carboxylesterase
LDNRFAATTARIRFEADMNSSATTGALRTPDERFAGLPGWSYAPHYIDDLKGFEGLRLHYLDEGPIDARHCFLCLHGEPTWAYLYRRMIPLFLTAGGRVVAPDFFGFGRSDKPTVEATYTWDFHRDTLVRTIERLELSRITLVVQDWGGLLGLTLPVSFPDRIARLLIMNTGFGTGDKVSDGFIAWRDYAAKNPDLAVGRLIARGAPQMTAAEIAAYDAPFPDARYKAGVRRFPQIVPIRPDMDGVAVSRRALAWWRDEFNGKSFMAIGMKDPVFGLAEMMATHRLIRGCPEPLRVTEGGHFVQEWGEEIARAALANWDDT